MTSYSTGTATGTGATAAFYEVIRTAAAANSWTEHDVISSVSGSKDIVFRGAALDSTADVRPFVRITQSANTFNFIGYSDWDTSTHAGINAASSGSNASITLQDPTFTYQLWMNGYGMHIAAKISSAWNHTILGFTRRGFTSTKSGITKATGSLSAAATSIPVASDMTTKLKVGQKVWVMNYAHSSASANAAHAELVTISAVGASTLTVSALAQAYDTGAVIGARVCPLIIGSASATTALTSAAFSPLHVDATRTSATGQTSTPTNNVFSNEANVDPDDTTSEYGSGVCAFSATAAAKTGFSGFPYGVGVFAGGAQSIDDVMDDGIYTYAILTVDSSAALCIGPREV